MPDPSPVVHALADRLRLPLGVAAQVDWGAGMLLVNRGIEQWGSFFHNPLGDMQLWTTLEHEGHHIIQISTLTYLYRFALTLHAHVSALLNVHYGDLAALPETLGEHAESMKNLVWDLTWHDENGLSVVDIVESLTWFNQHGDETPGVDAYRAALKQAQVSDAYKRGFEVFAARTGGAPHAWALYPVVSHLALCSFQPRRCFLFLADAVATGRIGNEVSVKELRALCTATDPDFAGFAWEYSRRIPELPIRFTFAEAQKSLMRDEPSAATFWRYLFRPQDAALETIIGVLNQTPVLLNPIADSDHGGFRKWNIDARGIRDLGAFKLEQRRFWFLYLAAVSRKYVEPIGVAPATALKVA